MASAVVWKCFSRVRKFPVQQLWEMGPFMGKLMSCNWVCHTSESDPHCSVLPLPQHTHSALPQESTQQGHPQQRQPLYSRPSSLQNHEPNRVILFINSPAWGTAWGTAAQNKLRITSSPRHLKSCPASLQYQGPFAQGPRTENHKLNDRWGQKRWETWIQIPCSRPTPVWPLAIH